ncbi:13473_t:CDS:1, partial [Gigaspora rosea]
HNEQIINLSSFSNSLSSEVQITDSTVNNIPSALHTILPWTISPKMQQIIDDFENKILCQFPCVPCSICSKLMYPEKSM